MCKDPIHAKVMNDLEDNFDQFKRRGVWGECEFCPLSHPEAASVPENCVHSTRDDHLRPLSELVEKYNSAYSALLRKEAKF